MSVMVLGPELLRQIAAAIAEARKHTTPIQTTMKAAEGVPQGKSILTLEDRSPDHKPKVTQQVLIPVGYRASISFEEQPAGLCRHLSISIENRPPGVMPSVIAVKMICAQFGVNFDNGLIWEEEYEPGRFAINIVSLDSDTDEPDSAKALVEFLDKSPEEKLQ